MVSARTLKQFRLVPAAVSLTLMLAIVSCGGGSSTPPPPVVTTPSITAFAPTAGVEGTAVIITGKRLTGATAVSFNGTAAAFTVASDTQISTSVPTGTTTGKISVTTPTGTAMSAANFTISLPTPPVISGFAPGSGQVGSTVTINGNNFSGTTAVAFNGTAAAGFTATSNTQITAIVPNGATTGKISVTNGGGTTSSTGNFTVTTAATGLDYSIDGMYITQSTQDYPGASVPLVKDRRGWIRVFVKANQVAADLPSVRVQFSNGCTGSPITITSTVPAPTVIDPENSPTWNSAVDSSCIQPGVSMTVTVDPANTTSEPVGNKANNSVTKTAAELNVRTLTQWKVTLLPVHTGDGRTGNVNQAPRLATDWVEFGKRLHPVPDNVDVVVAPTFNSSVTSLSSNGNGWNTVLNQLQAKRTSDVAAANQRYYYGVVNVGYNSGVAGLGFIGFPAAMGWDFPGFDEVLAHEVGHNFNREHSPGCGAGSPDPAYPYANGLIGVTGWDAFATSGNLKSMNVYNDIMNYCNPQWISDYVYKSILSFRQAQGFDVAPAAAPASGEGLLVWGRIENGKTILEPAFRVAATGIKPATGSYKWEAQDALGNALASMSFDAPRVADLPGGPVQMFAFVVPMSTQALDAVRSLRVMKDGQELTRTLPTAQFSAEPAPTAPAYLGGHRAQLTWNADRYPMAMIRDARTGEVRGFLQGGTATVVDAPDDMEVQYSDGVRATKLRYQSPAQ